MSKSQNVENTAPDKLSEITLFGQMCIIKMVLVRTIKRNSQVVQIDWNRSAVVIPATKPIKRMKSTSI